MKKIKIIILLAIIFLCSCIKNTNELKTEKIDSDINNLVDTIVIKLDSCSKADNY